MVSKLDWDLLPEEFPYEDRGCDMAPSCLGCPFPKCLEEEPWGKQKFSKRRRAERMAELRREGKSIEEIAGIFGVSERTVGRALKAVPAVILKEARRTEESQRLPRNAHVRGRGQAPPLQDPSRHCERSEAILVGE